MKNKLIKGKIIIETEIVVENFYNESLEKCIESAFLFNRQDIINQAIEGGEFKCSNCEVVKSINDLPKKWEIKSLPWLPNINFGDKKQWKENTLESFFNKK